MSRPRHLAKLRRWKERLQAPQRAAAAADQLAGQFLARFAGKIYSAYILARSFTQYSNWLTDHFENIHDYDKREGYAIFVQQAKQLEGVKFNSVVVLVELNGWEEAATPELLATVRQIKQVQGL